MQKVADGLITVCFFAPFHVAKPGYKDVTGTRGSTMQTLKVSVNNTAPVTSQAYIGPF